MLAEQIANLAPEQRALLEARLRERRAGRPGGTIPPQPRDGRPLPLSAAQRRLWLLERLESGSAAYNLAEAVRLRGPLDIGRLRVALATTVARHEALRTVIRVADGEPQQRILELHRSGAAALPVVDLGRLPPERRLAEVRRHSAAEAARPFDLSRGPLLRVVALRMALQDHAVLYTMHHIISDAWSVGIFLREVIVLYGSRDEGGSPPLPELPIQYADFASWQLRQLEGEAMQEELDYWRRRLDGVPTLLSLPTDRPRSQQRSHAGASLPVRLGAGLSGDVRDLGRRLGTTPFSILMASFQILLSRYSGQRDLCVGTSVAGRDRVEIEGLIGFFVNTLAIRANLSDDLPFRDFLEQMKRWLVEDLAHQRVPFERLVEELRPERGADHTPVFQVLLLLQNAPGDLEAPKGLEAQSLPTDNGASKFDLSLLLAQESEGFKGQLVYSTELFDHTTVLRLEANFRVLLETVLADPSQRLRELRMLAPAERAQILAEWNDTRYRAAGPGLVHRLFEAQVRRTPEAVAVVFGASCLSYRELDRRAGRLAEELRARGVGPETRVGLLLPRSDELIVGILGILKAGGAYVPLDPSNPPQRLAWMLEEAGIALVVSQRRLARRLPENGPPRCFVTSGETRRRPANPHRRPLPGNLVYVVFTSGSSGRPKGVAVEHRQLVDYLRGMRERLALDPGVRFATLSAVATDLGNTSLFLSLITGGSLRVLAQDQANDANALADSFERRPVDCLKIVPSHLAALMSVTRPERLLPGRWLLLGGEAASRNLLARLWSLVPPRCELLNHYGPTETTVGTLCFKAPRNGAERFPVGRPLENARVILVDEQDRLVPLGAVGEALIGGAGLARGYLGRPGLTAGSFVPDAFSREPGARLYRTGDRMRYLSNGDLEFVGRTDHQLKSRGFRIEPAEIEAALAEHPALGQTVVVQRDDAPGGPGMVAYLVVGEPRVPLAAAELREFLAARLPDEMLPVAFVVLDALPLNRNGKVDRRALPVPEAPIADERGAPEEPRSPHEELVLSIWRDVLGNETLGIRDNFFAVGGHSLLAVRVVSRIREVFGVEFPIHRIFESLTVAGTVAALAAMLETGAKTRAGAEIPAIEAGPRPAELPLAYNQQRLWFQHQFEPGNASYNQPLATRIRGPLKVAVLEACLNEIRRRHEALRTTFPTVDGRGVQIVAPARPWVFPRVDLSSLPEPGRSAEARRLAVSEARRAFDLARGPVVRLTLLRLANVEHVLLLTAHHLVVDDASFDILARELRILYPAFSERRPSPLKPLPVQYADFALWQRRWLTGDVLERQLSYWRQQLRDLPALALPTDRPRPAVRGSRGRVVVQRLRNRLAAGLELLGLRHSTTSFMTLLSCFAALLSRYTGQADVALGTPIANRGRVELEGLIGFFLNTIVIRADFSGDPSFREVLARVRKTALDAYAHQDLPFERLVEEIKPVRDLSRTPLFQVMFVSERSEEELNELGDLALEPATVPTGTTRFDLTLTVEERGGGLNAGLDYDPDLFDETTAARMLRHFEMLCAGALADEETPLSRLSLLSQAERHHLVAAWNDTGLQRPGLGLVHRIFERQAARNPEAVALACEGEVLSYGELNRRANRLAHLLGDLGIGPERVVGICLERSVELVVAIYGVAKAGAAFLPLDPDYPPTRLDFMLTDAEADLVLTREADSKRLPEGRCRLLRLDAAVAEIARQPERDPESLPSPENLAYVLYTSGSTGRPKGAMNTHRGLGNRILWMQETFRLSASDRVIQKTPASFDVSVWEFFWPLSAGAGLVLARPGGHREPEYLARLIAAESVTTAHFVPSMLRVFLDQDELAGCRCLRRLIASGEVLTAELERAFFARFDAGLYNLYGPTEAAIDVTSWACDGDPGRPRIPIGRPISNTRVHLFDRRGQPVAIGLTGELYLGGAGLGRGYVGRPSLTAERFVPDPTGPTPGARLYRTGDLARRLPDGAIDFLGRVDDQVKIRGFRVELGEIEAALERHPAVRECAVTALREESGRHRLVAYLAPVDGMPSVGELRGFLAESLPEFMLPAAWVSLESLPSLPNGKVDRGALPAPEPVRPQLGKPFVRPRTDRERQLARIWCEVLRLDRVGVDDNFFELGGDSILSIQIVARAHQAGLRLTPRQIFEHQTLGELARVAPVGPGPAAEQGTVRGPVPLTPIQRRFFDQRLTDPHHFNQTLLLRVEETLEPGRLERAVAAVIAHHDALRLRFERRGEAWYQEHADPADCRASFVHVDLRGLPPAVARVSLERVAARLQRSFELGRAPLLRVGLFEVAGGGGQRLLLSAHHLVVDGVSWRILLADLETAYRQLADGGSVALPPKTTSYKAWAEALGELAAAPETARQADGWLGRLRSAAPLFPAAAGRVGQARRLTVSLGAEETRALLSEAPRAYHGEITDLLLCALTLAMSGLTGSRRLLLDLEGHGREELPGVETSRTVGWFTSIFPVLLDLTQTEDPGGAIRAVKEQLRAIPQGGLGYGLSRYLGEPKGRRDLAASPAPQVIFNYLGQLDRALGESSPFAAAPESPGPPRSPRQRRSHVLEINASVAGGRLSTTWTYNPELQSEQTVRELAEAHHGALRSLVDHCLSPGAGGHSPSDFPLADLDQVAIDRLTSSFPAVEDLYPLSPLQEGLLFHSLSTPERDVYQQQLSCQLRGELDEKAFELAWRQLIDHHPALRTTFCWRQVDRPLQVVHREVQSEIDALDWSALSAGEQERLLAAQLEEIRRRPVALDRPPLMRLVLIRLGDDLHQLVWTSHHLILDGWSLAMLIPEFFGRYRAARQDRPPILRQTRPFRDYIAWIQRQDRASAETFWRRYLRGFEAPTAMGLPGGREAADYRQERAVVSAAATARIRDWAQHHKLTLATLVQATWAQLLSRYSGEEDVVFGAVTSGRWSTLPGVDGMVGMLINTLPVRVSTPSDAIVLPWLRQLQVQQSTAREFDYTPLARVQAWSEVPPGRPLFDSVLIFDNYPVAESTDGRHGELEITDADFFERTNYPLTLIVAPGTEMPIRVLYDVGRFDGSTVRRLLGHFQVVLQGLVDCGGERLAELPLLSAAERAQILVEWNDTVIEEEPAGPGLHELFEAQVRRTGDAVALVDGDRQLTYGELERLADRWAARLARLGVGPEVLVAVCLRRGQRMVEVLLGILKAGGAYVAVDPGDPRERQAFLLSDSRAAVLVTEEGLLPDLPEHDGQVVLVNREPPPSAAGDLRRAGPRHLAYVLYTSGSSGWPKGAAVRHRSAVALVRWAAETFSSAELAGVLAATSISFDLSVFELFVPLSLGGRIVLAADALALPELPARYGVTLINTVPTAMAELLRLRTIPDSVRTVNLAGEPLRNELAQELYRHTRVRRVLDLYGPSEDTTYSTFAPVERGATTAPRIGRPVTGTRAYVLGPQGRPVPLGVAGELCLAGAGLARGYLHRPALTAERFVPDVRSPRPGGRLYRTGDRVRLLPDGQLDFLGRFDQQVKVRGFRIEVGEIENTLERHPEVERSVVAVRAEEEFRNLVAYFVPAGDRPPSPAELRRFLARSLPGFMVPAIFVALEALPQTPNGKIDRRALPAPEETRPRLEAPFRAPSSAAERQLAAIWCRVLHVDRVGVDDNFLELGGDSILSLQVVALAAREGLRLTPRLVFEHQTLRELAAAANTAPVIRAEQGPVTGDATLTPVQRWFFEQELVDPHHFNQALLLEVRERLEAGRLARAAHLLTVHHDALRLRFDAGPEHWRQFHAEPASGAGPVAPAAAPLISIDLSALPASRAPEALARGAAQLQASLDLERGPLVRLGLFELAPGEPQRLLILAHHLVVDGVSWRILLEDLESSYRQLGSAGDPGTVELPPKTTSFKTWGEALGAHARSQAVRDERGYWLDRRRAAVVPLPAEGGGGIARSASVSLDEQITRRCLGEALQPYRLRIDELLLAALAEAMGRWTGRRRLLCDLESHGREELPEVDVSRTVGWFTSIYPVLLDLEGASGPAAMITAVKEQLRSVPGHGLGYGLLRYLGDDRRLRRRLAELPQAQVVFNYLGQLDRAVPESSPFRLAPESAGPARSPRQRQRYLLEINAQVAAGRLTVRFTDGGGALGRGVLEALAQGWREALSSLVEHCLTDGAGHPTPSDFPAAELSAEELARVVGGVGSPTPDATVEAIYPLSAPQEGMLYETLAAPVSGVHVEQWSCELGGDLHAPSFERAWRRAVERHGILRTGFVWEGHQRPLQVTLDRAAVEIEWRDWRLLSPEAREEQLSSFLAADRRRGFDPGRPPLLRLAILRTGDASRLVWSHHHILMDGWCRPLLLQEVLRLYHAFRNGEEPEEPAPACPYGDYLRWLRKQDPAPADAYWRRVLEGFEQPTPLGREESAAAVGPPAEGDRYRRVHAALGAEPTAALERSARRHRLTLNTFVQGAWALLLSRYSNARDVLFGITVSGRPADLPGIERTLGLFINTLPLRLRVSPEAELVPWLGQVLAANLELREYEHTPGDRVRRASEVPPGRSLYESLLVFENYPLPSIPAGPPETAVEIRDVRSAGARTHHALVLLAVPGEKLHLHLIADGRKFWPGDEERILTHLRRLLEIFATEPEQRLGTLAQRVGAEEVPRLLPQPSAAGSRPAGTAPTTDAERRVAAIWSEVLGIAEPGRDDNFFELGGHSLSAAQLVHRLEESFAGGVSLRTLFAHPTLAGLAAELSPREENRSGSDAGVLPRVEHDAARRFDPFPLTDVQQAYWLGRNAAFELGNVATHLYSELEASALDVGRLNLAWQKLIDRHDMLRAVILPDGRQQVLETVPEYRFARLDLRGIAPDDASRALAEVREEMSHQVLPAERWPLFDIRVSLLDDDRIRLHVSFDLLIGDGWSYRLLQRELALLYAGRERELEPLEITFRDLVRAERDLRRSELYRSARAYWRERLPALPAGPGLPLARSPAEIGKPRFGRRRGELTAAAWQHLAERGRRAGLTPSGLLLAAFAEVLTTWSTSPRYTVNLTLFHRPPFHPQVDSVVGDFTSLVLCVVDGSAGGSFETRARRLQEQLWNDLDHRYVSGVEVLRDLARQRGGSVAGTMPVVFTSALPLSEDAGAEAVRETASGQALPGTEQVFSISQTSQVWLDHQVSQTANGDLVFWWDVVEDLFPEGLIDDMFAAYRDLLDRLTAGGEAWELPASGGLIPTRQLEQRRRINATAVAAPKGLLHQRFFDRTREEPDRPAVIAPDRTLSYGELARCARHLAGLIARQGVGPDELVAVVMEPGWEQLVAVLGVLASGAAYLPVDPELPEERLRVLLELGRVEIAVTQPAVERRLRWPAGIRRLAVTEDLPGGTAAVPAAAGDPGDLAYVIFTSGTTGVPKGVMIEHRAALNTVIDVNRRFAVGPADRVLALSSLSFDLSVYDIFGPLAAGAAVVLPEAEMARDPAHWADLVASHGVTVWSSVPQLMQMLVDFSGDRARPRMDSLRRVMLSGDWIPVGLPDRIRALAPAAEITSLGGATEASIWSILYPIGAVDPSWSSIPYGRPMANQTFHVLDGELEPRPTWVPGDLYIGGLGLARGYWCDPEKTAASFVVHPRTGERLYATGDRGRYRADGEIEFLGREDLQVKVRGFRVELGEIEAVLEQHPQVEAAVAVAVEDEPAHCRLTAFVVPATSPANDLPPVEDAPGFRRRFVAESLGIERLAEGLGILRQIRLAGEPLPKLRYPSAGSLYPVQVYLGVRDGRVEGLAAGWYYYHPRDDVLVCLVEGGEGMAELCPSEEPEAAFFLVLVGRSDAISPIYPHAARDLCLLEAGYMEQLLLRSMADGALGLWPLERLAADRLRRLLEVEAEEEILLAMVAGPVSGEAAPGDDPPPATTRRATGSAWPTTSGGTLTDEAARVEFKLGERGLRRDLGGRARRSLPPRQDGEAFAAACRRRTSHRQFLQAPISWAGLERLLEALAESPPGGSSRRRRYPSAGGLYPVRTYLQIRAACSGGEAPGLYAYDSRTRRLTPLAPEVPWEERVHDPVNRPIAAGAAFAIFLVVPEADEPVEDRVRDLWLMEAGAMGQLLMERAPAAGLGLCPIGSLDTERLSSLLQLDAGTLLLHSFLGGPIAPPAADGAASALGDELRAYSGARLPAYMVPAAVVPLAELPLTGNGKVDRAALHQMAARPAETRASGVPYTAPRSAVEKILSNLCRDLLAVERVGIHDSFFALGGDSVKGIQLLARLQEAGYELSPRQLFENQTIAEMALIAEPAVVPQDEMAAAGEPAGTAAQSAEGGDSLSPEFPDAELSQEELEELLAELEDPEER